ncbi:MAG TPA: FAD-binding oxidoreductase [Kiritimatiellia bacterium]|nr:FAD-binding oxidoreductase [Kiritimatiellia bacterium]HRU70557.1 FAD-binding oxidoreductase [Kiritimatiellia bacterium]
MPLDCFTTPVPPDYLRDESRKNGSAAAIAFPKTVQELTAALKQTAPLDLPLTIQGARTGIAAGAVPDGGLIINLSHMDAILGPGAGDASSPTVRVQPGVPLTALRRHLATAFPAHLFTPDPTETSASIGGMAACNASGACSFAYGPTRNHIQAITVVLADGDTLVLRRGHNKADGNRFSLTTDSGRLIAGDLPRIPMPAVKNSAGYWVKPDMDLLDLFIGSEGTLGILAEIEVCLQPKPFQTQGILCYFADEADALTCVQALRAAARAAEPHTLAAIEYFDADALRLIRTSTAHTGLLLPPAQPTWNVALYVEWALSSHAASSVELTSDILMSCHGDPRDTWFASDAPSLDKLKAFRHAVPEQVNALIAERKRQHPGLTKLGTDFSVPDDKLEAVMRLYRQDLSAARLEHVIFGHIGNNHLHVNILPRDMAEYAEGKRLVRSWAEQVVAWGGSVSGEHGIGRLKKDLLAVMVGREGLAGMRRLKAVFDPAGRLNPDRLFD